MCEYVCAAGCVCVCVQCVVLLFYFAIKGVRDLRDYMIFYNFIASLKDSRLKPNFQIIKIQEVLVTSLSTHIKVPINIRMVKG